MNIPNRTQEGRVLQVISDAEGGWVKKQYFVREMMLTQARRAIFNLENDPKWQKEYQGYVIEHSTFRDERGFKSYRLRPERTNVLSPTSRTHTYKVICVKVTAR